MPRLGDDANSLPRALLMTAVVAAISMLQYLSPLNSGGTFLIDPSFGAMVACFALLGHPWGLLPGCVAVSIATLLAPDASSGFRAAVTLLPTALIATQALRTPLSTRLIFDDPHRFLALLLRMLGGAALGLVVLNYNLVWSAFTLARFEALAADYFALLGGMLLVVPLWAAVSQGGHDWQHDLRGQIERWSVLLQLGLIASLVFMLDSGLSPLLLVPVLLWAALRLSVIDTCYGILLLGLIAMVGAAVPAGPFAHLEHPHWQAAFAISCLATTGLILNVSVRLQRRLRHGLDQSEVLFRTMIEDQSDAIIRIGADGRLLYANAPARRLCELPAIGEAVNNAIETLYRLCLARLHGEQTTIAEQQKIHDRDGRCHPIIWHIHGHFESGQLVSMQCVGRDCSEEAAARAELERNQRELQVLLSNMPGMAYRGPLLPDRPLHFASDGAATLTGYAPGLLTGNDRRPYAELIHADDRDQVWQTIREAARDGRSFALTYRLLRGDGQTRWVQERGCPTAADADGTLQIEGFVHDINESHVLEGELRRAMETAQLADQAKTAFLANMSHDMRTPLNGILGTADLLCQHEHLSDDDRELAELICESSRHLLRIINDLLDITKIESGRFSLMPTPYEPARVITNAVQNQIAAATAKGISLHAMVSPQVPRTLLLDGERLNQVVLNLISNAIKFTEVGSITVRMHVTYLDHRTAGLAIVVSDSGIGIDTTDASRVFRRFGQVDGSHTRKQQGTGLGLNISRELLRMMKGDLSFTSHPGQGSVFTGTLEVGRIEHGEPTPLSTCDNLLIVILDDDSAWQDLVDIECRDGGAQVERFDSIDAVVQRVKTKADGERIAIFANAKNNDAQILQQRIETAALDEQCSLVMVGGPRRPVDCRYWLAGTVFGRDFADCLDDLCQRPMRLTPGSSIQRPVISTNDRAALAGARILLAEDNEINQVVARRMLTELGCIVSIACNGQEAVTRCSEESFDGILMDCQMPSMDGWEACRLIRAAEQPDQHVPIIAVTAHAADENRDDCRNAGMDAFIAKPLRLDQLAATLIEHVRATDLRYD